MLAAPTTAATRRVTETSLKRAASVPVAPVTALAPPRRPVVLLRQPLCALASAPSAVQGDDGGTAWSVLRCNTKAMEAAAVPPMGVPKPQRSC